MISSKMGWAMPKQHRSVCQAFEPRYECAWGPTDHLQFICTHVHHEVITHCCVPYLQAIDLALEQAGNASAETTIFMDDSTRNIVAGHQKGLATILVSMSVNSAALHCIALHWRAACSRAWPSSAQHSAGHHGTATVPCLAAKLDAGPG